MQESQAPSTTDLAKVAKALGATMLVQGSVQQAGDRLRVHTNLVTPDGRVVWSDDRAGREVANPGEPPPGRALCGFAPT